MSYCGGTRIRATMILARFEGFYIILKSMILRPIYTGRSILLPKVCLSSVQSELPSEGNIVVGRGHHPY